MGKAVKIIDIDETGEKFILREDALYKIFSKVPDDLPVSIVGVVGAFRTGKSFLLDFFLRYLKNTDGSKLDVNFSKEDKILSWMHSGGKLEGRDGKSKTGFTWKSGQERCTTGCWMWSDYFVRKDPLTQKQTAVFVLDTQGMYDSETGQHLTASIFGLGTLISSYTVYNLMFQIQEDHLQHLALFSEYGRVALNEASKHGNDKDFHPFQKLEFLVRDFPHFKKGKDTDLEVLHQDMANYLEKVMSSKFQKDLKEVRDQVELCYEEISCYCLPHPGMEVAEEEENFDGDIDIIRDKFKRLLGDYIRRVFNERISIKKIQGEEMTAMKLFEYIKVYCKLFQESEIFPEAMTLFRATQEANIAYAIHHAVGVYKENMDKVAGIGANYIKEEELNAIHKEAVRAAVKDYHTCTKLGAEAANKEGEKRMKKEIAEKYSDYKESNRLRDPLSFVAPYIIPLLVALGAYIIRYILETVCPRRSYTCMDFADFFGSLYFVIVSFLLFHMLSTFYGVRSHLGAMFSVVKPKQD